MTKLIILITIISMDLLTGMEFDLFVPSFPILQSEFHLSPFFVEGLLSINFIGYCLSLFFVGSLADRYGRKLIILLGLITFVVGSIFCLWAMSYPFLLIGRFLQGAGIAAPAILSFLIIADTYPLKQQQYLMAILNGFTNIAIGIAPVIGSYLTLYFHWQGNFAALLLLGLVTLIMTVIFIPSYPLPEKQENISLRGYLPLFQSKPLMLLIMTLVLIFAPYWIFVGISPILYMKGLHVSLSHFGYYQGSFALIFGIGSILLGFMIKRQQQNKMLNISIGLLMMSFMSVAFITWQSSANPLFITLAFLPFIIAQIIPSVILYPLCLNFIPHAKGRVSSMLQGIRLIFSALALQVAGYYYDGSFQNVGMIIIVCIFAAIVTLYFVINNRQILAIS